MNWIPESERGLAVRGPGWWSAAAVLLTLLIPVSPAWPGDPLTVGQLTGTLIPIGLAWSILSLVAAEWMRRSAPDDPKTVLRAQPFSGAAIIGVGLALSALAIRIRSTAIDVDASTRWSLWALGATLAGLASLQLFLSTRRLIVRGREANSRLEVAERDAHSAELMVLQQQLDPGLLMNALAAVAARADAAPREAERAVEGLATYLRRSLQTPPMLQATLDEEMLRAGEYADIMALASVQAPVVFPQEHCGLFWTTRSPAACATNPTRRPSRCGRTNTHSGSICSSPTRPHLIRRHCQSLKRLRRSDDASVRRRSGVCVSRHR